MCALGTGQEALKSDICVELKSDMSKIRVDLMTQVHAMENKMGNCMSAIREELETQIGDLCTVQAELGERLGKQQENVTSIVEQQVRNLREEIEAQLAAVEPRSRRARGGGPGASTTTVKPPKFDGATSWAVFHRQFEAAAVQNNWMPSEKAAHLLSVLHITW
jgi:cob(I)alamin adenosyltransferase